jgi:hypothetical protein
MNSFDIYHENPHWASMYKYAMTEIPNGGYFEKYPQTNSMRYPQFIKSDEHSHTSLKRGQFNQNPYEGGLKNFAPGFTTPKMQARVKNCIQTTANPEACHRAAVNKVKELVYEEEMRHPGFTRRSGIHFPLHQ